MFSIAGSSIIRGIEVIAFHGTPIGSTRIDVARFLRGRHALVPYAGQEDLPIALEVCKSIILDNSAFTLWKRGETLKGQDLLAWVHGYLKWVESIWKHPTFFWALICDVINGTEKDNDALLRDWNARIPGVPVWHLHESLDRLVRLCNEYPTVAFGSSGEWSTPGTVAWWQRMNQALNVICDEEGRPICKLHGLRMLDSEIFTRIPFASADSTNAAQNAGSLSRFGLYKPPTSSQRAEVIAERIEAHNSAAVWRGYQQESFLWQENENGNLQLQS
jgi:hypothetical protein